MLGAFATRFYASWGEEGADLVPPEVFLPGTSRIASWLEGVLRDRAGRAVRLQIPQRGEKARLVELAERNARHLLEERKLLGAAVRERAPDALYELQEVLELPVVPRRLVCLDISHTQGSETVASCVFFEDGAPNRAEYRRFRIRGAWENDDFRSMHEAVTRYSRSAMAGGEASPGPRGDRRREGQLSSALAALEELGLGQLAMISLAKREEEIFRPAGHRTPAAPSIGGTPVAAAGEG